MNRTYTSLRALFTTSQILTLCLIAACTESSGPMGGPTGPGDPGPQRIHASELVFEVDFDQPFTVGVNQSFVSTPNARVLHFGPAPSALRFTRFGN